MLSSRHLVVRCRPAFPAYLRLVFPSSRFISSAIASPVSSPLFDTVGRGVRRGASASCLLGFCPAVCVDVDSRFIPYLPAMSLRSACSSARMRGDVLVRDVLRCPAWSSSRLSSLASFIIPSVGSVRLVSRPVLRHDGRGGGRLRCGCGVLSFLVLSSRRLSRSPCLLALGRFSPSI